MTRKNCVLVLAMGLAGCGGGSVMGPSSPAPTAYKAATAPLAVPGRLRAVWASAESAGGRVARYSPNAVVLQVESWADDYTGLAAWLRERGIGVLPYVEQCFTAPRAAWDACWSRVEAVSAPFKAAGILWGYHVMDEPATKGLGGVRDEANAYVRARGYEVMGTEWIEYVSDMKPWRVPRPAGVRWYGVTCYAYGSRTPWSPEGCAEEYGRHPDWDTVVVPASGDVCPGGRCEVAMWEATATRLGRGVAFWETD